MMVVIGSLWLDKMAVQTFIHKPLIQVTTDVREARLIDLLILNKLFVQSVESDFAYFDNPFKKKLIQQHNLPRLAKAKISPRAHLLLAWSSNQPVGYCVVRTSPERITYLHWMYVIDEVRGRGLGAGLLQRAIGISQKSRAERLQLVTHDKQAFYRRHNFRDVAHVPGLQGGVDMTIMELQHGR